MSNGPRTRQAPVQGKARDRCKGAGNLQQQAAATGAIQAISYCPTMGPAFARTVAANGALHPLVDMLSRGPVAMRCAAAGALCNLSLGCPDNQVGPQP